MEPTREIYGNIVGGELVYLVMVISFGLVGWALYRHYCLWMQGRPDNRVQALWRRLLVVLGSGFVVDGLRIGGTELHQHPCWAAGSPVGAAIAWVLDRLILTESQFLLWHRLWWWAHMLVTFGLLTYIGYSKLSHMIFSPLNIFLHKTRANGA